MNGFPHRGLPRRRGLFIATLLTLLFLPALYVNVYGAKKPQKPIEATAAGREPVYSGAANATGAAFSTRVNRSIWISTVAYNAGPSK